MGLTVDQLVAMPHLRTTVRAGGEGGDRLVMWAHSCELAAPWEWLGTGDLLMTTGLAIPAGADEQRRFVTRLAAAGLAGIAIGQELHAPPLTTEVLAAADEQAFPVLETAYEVPFVAVARAVSLANQSLEHSRLVDAIRVYDTMRMATIAGKPPEAVVEALATQLGVRLAVLDRAGRPVFAGAPAAPRQLAEHVARLAAERAGSLPSVLRLDGGATLVLPIPSRRFAVLLVEPRGRPADLSVLQHAATVIALEVERLSAQREQRLRLGAELLAHMIDQRMDPALIDAGLQAHGFDGDELVLAACRVDEAAVAELHHRLSDAAPAHLLLRRDGILHMLVPAASGALDVIDEALGADRRVGLSETFTAPGRAADAAREARWALKTAVSDELPDTRYGERAPLFLPRTLAEARTAVDRVLGRLVAYDDEHGTELVRSLAIFLACNRSWQRACAELHVHKQTLVYRMQRVEALTGRRLRDTGDVAELWLALRARETAGAGASSAGTNGGPRFIPTDD